MIKSSALVLLLIITLFPARGVNAQFRAPVVIRDITPHEPQMRSSWETKDPVIMEPTRL